MTGPNKRGNGHTVRNFTLGILLLMFGSGCSVGMAMSGSKEPDWNYVKQGATRGEIELSVGIPVKSKALADGKRVDVYEYDVGNEPSKGRAWMHGILDVLSLTLWEVFATPYEHTRVGKKRIAVQYGEDDRVMAIKQLPDPKPNIEQVPAMEEGIN